MKFGFLKKQSDYLWLMFGLVLGHGLYMTYFFPREWAESINAVAFVDAVAVVVPVIHNLKNHSPSYTPYWGMFYATFWCLTPLFFAAGMASTFFFAKENYDKMKLNKPSVYVVGVLFFFITLMIPLFLPFIGNFPNPLFNQMSSFLLLRLLAWWTTGMFAFALGWIVGCCYQRFFNKNTEGMHDE